MPYNWRRPASSSSESPPIRPNRSSGKPKFPKKFSIDLLSEFLELLFSKKIEIQTELFRKFVNCAGSSSYDNNSGSESLKRSPSPTLPFPRPQPPQQPQREAPRFISNSDLCCPACDEKYDEIQELKQPRILPCLHSFCTGCLIKVYDYLEALHAASLKQQASRPASRYSWRARHSSPSRGSSPTRTVNNGVLGLFICPQCHNSALISASNEGRECIKGLFPLDPLAIFALKDSNSSGSESSSSSNKSQLLLNLVVQEIQPKIRVIQKAVFETETAKQTILDNVRVVEGRLMPTVPSESEQVSRVRNELLEVLHKSKTRRLNAIVKRQVILKQCEKVTKKIRYSCSHSI